MSPELHNRVRTLFEHALERPEAERLAFLATACGGEQEVFQAVERLLVARDKASSFLVKKSPASYHVGRYVISRELGRGAMGVVYEAIDPLIGRSVAVKIIRLESLAGPGDARFLRDRLFREARSAGSLSHPGIVTIFDVGQEGDEAFIAMERVNGLSLAETLAGNPYPARDMALNILRQTAAALDYAHRNGVIHRDIKPANIMLDQDVTVKITDFGIAKVVSTDSQTLTNLVLGTPSYMSPEQIEAQALDGKSDQFSLAAMAFQLLTGAVPFQSGSLPSLLHHIVYGQRPSAREVNPALSPGVDDVLRRGLERNAAQRYSNCAEFVGALEHAMGPATVVDPEPRAPDSRTTMFTRPRMRPAIVVSAALCILLAGAYGGFVFVSGHKRPPEHPPVAPAALSIPAKPAVSPPIVQSAPPQASDAPVVPEPPPATAPAPIDKAERARQIYKEANANRNRPGKRLELLRQAAELGEVQAMNELAAGLADGDGLDDPEVLRWYRKAADGGNAAAMVQLGVMYLLGTGDLDQDQSEAARWFGKAADAGSPAGMYDLGMMYEEGQGVPEDPAKARQLYSRAAALGHVDARQRLSALTH